MPKTSLSHPLRVDEVHCAPFADGVLGLTFCPGKEASSLSGDPWSRDLDLDLDRVRDWGAQVALTLIETHEFELLKVPGLGEGFKSRGIEWHHLPIVDGQAPDARFLPLWRTSGTRALDCLRTGGKVLVHCRGGLGRAGTVATALLMELGLDTQAALARVRRARPGAVETRVQEQFLARYSLPLGRSGEGA